MIKLYICDPKICILGWGTADSVEKLENIQSPDSHIVGFDLLIVWFVDLFYRVHKWSKKWDLDSRNNIVKVISAYF